MIPHELRLVVAYNAENLLSAYDKYRQLGPLAGTMRPNDHDLAPQKLPSHFQQLPNTKTGILVEQAARKPFFTLFAPD